MTDPAAAHRAANRRHYRRASARPRKQTRPRPVVAAMPVRVITFTLQVTGSDSTRTEKYRLVTTLLEPAAAPAAELAAAYARRWAVETSFQELKTYLRGGPGTVLRSRDPDGIHQELWAFLIIYQAIRIIIRRRRRRRRTGPRPDFLHYRPARHPPLPRHRPRPPRGHTRCRRDRHPRPTPPPPPPARAVLPPAHPHPARSHQPHPPSTPPGLHHHHHPTGPATPDQPPPATTHLTQPRSQPLSSGHCLRRYTIRTDNGSGLSLASGALGILRDHGGAFPGAGLRGRMCRWDWRQ